MSRARFQLQQQALQARFEMTGNVSVEAHADLNDLLPHATPMVLLSGYEPWPGNESATAFVDVSPVSPFYEIELGGVPSCVALEYMAQTMALLVGLARRKKGLKPQLGFVLGSRKLETLVPKFANGARYRVTVTCVYQDESFGSFDCAIVDAAGEICAKGTLTAFQPGEDVSLEQLG